MKTASAIDFRGGYFLDEAPELIPGNGLLIAENCYWRDGLQQRGGHKPYATATYAADDVIRGVSQRYYINGAWMNIEAVDVDTASKVRFFWRATTGLTAVDNTFEWTTGTQVYFAEIDGHIVAVNGVDKPAVIYYDGGYKIETLEAHDLRTRGDTTWNAGQYTDIGPVWTDDTTDAQDGGADDFQITSTTNNDGFFIACTHTFNKVIITSASQAAGAPVIEYKYYADDSTWKSCDMIATPTWTAVAGTRTIEFNYPSDMGRYDGAETILGNRFMLRVRFTTAPGGAVTADYMAVYQSQSITEFTGSDQPTFCLTHNSRMWLAVGYIAFWSPPYGVTGWRGLSEAQHFLEGGPQIRSMVSHKGYLVVFKDTAIYVFYGDSLETFLWKKRSDVGIGVGILSSVSAEQAYYLNQDGVRMFDGTKDIRVSDHIKTDIDGYTASSAVSVHYKGEVWMSFPDDSIVLVFDPATLKIDEETGDGTVAFFKFTGYRADYFINCNGSGDHGKLLAVVNTSTPYIAELETGTNDQNRAAAAVNTDYKMKTNYMAFIDFQTEKRYGLMKLKLKKASAETIYAVTIEADGGKRTASANVTVALGTKYFNHVSRPPYTLDGYNIAIQIRNNQLQDAGVRGISLQYEKKEF